MHIEIARLGARQLRWILGPVAAGLAMAAGLYAHEDEKGERIAAGLSATPAEFTVLNITLEGVLPLVQEADITSPSQTPQGLFLTADLTISGDYAYVGGFDNTLHIVDISRPEAMRQVARVQTPGPALDVKVQGDLAAIGVQSRASDFGLVMVDISDPLNPTILSEFSVRGWRGVHNLFLYEDRAYLAHSNHPGMTILDISDPTRPFVSGHWLHQEGFSNIVHDVFIGDGMAFVSD